MARAKALSYEEFMEYAKAHYEKGGDRFYECWDRKMFDMCVELFGGITKREALRMFRDAYEEERDIRATAW